MKLLSSNGGHRSDDTTNTAVGRGRYKKFLLMAFVGVSSVAFIIGVATTTNGGRPRTTSPNIKAPKTILQRLRDRRCNLTRQQIDEIRNYDNVTQQIVDYIRNGEGKGQTYAKLQKFVDRFGARMSGTKSLEDSIDYMLNELETEGLDDVHGEKVMVPHWVRGNESVVMVEPRKQRLFMLGLGDSVPTPPEGIKAEVIVVRTFDELSQKNESEVSGKIVVFNQDYDGYLKTVKYRYNGAVEAAKLGAVAVLIRSVTSLSISSPHTGWQRYDENVTKIPTACITVEDAELLERLTDQSEKVVVHLKMGCRSYPMKESRNVVAEITGDEYPEQVVIVSGHIDSWDVGQGAQDDGGGVFISTQVLSTLTALGLRPKRTLRAVLWTAEEPGIYGALQYAEDHANETDDWNMIMESDMGTYRPIGLSFAGQSNEAQCIMQEIMKHLEPINAGMLRLSNQTGPDLRPWVDDGVPSAILVSRNDEYFNYHHTHADTMTHMNSEHLDLCTIVWTIASYIVADLAEMLPR
ncbi:CPQ (predicted) [Pycnogonum litorale]